MHNKEIIVIEDRLYRESSVIVEFVTAEDGMKYNQAVISASAKKLADVLNKHLTSGFCDALREELQRRG